MIWQHGENPRIARKPKGRAGATLLGFLVIFCAGMAATAQDALPPEVKSAWARPTIGARTMTAAYLEIENPNPAPDGLVRVTSPGAAAVEIHETTQDDNGVYRMREIGGSLPLPPLGTLVMRPAGHHLMLMGLEGPLSVGDTLSLTLEFQSGFEVTVEASVRTTAP